VRYLLDTHALIWILFEPRRLSAAFARFVAETEADVFVSSISIAEIAIKHSIGKPSAPPVNGADAWRRSVESGFPPLPYAHEHAAILDRLPWRHKDPFDRMLIAQAMFEDLTVITCDPVFAAYRVPVLEC
jgi:PIN domain nuclease of toxin-antitoxin system